MGSGTGLSQGVMAHLAGRLHSGSGWFEVHWVVECWR